MIWNELRSGLNDASMDEIAPLCNFAHCIESVNFRNYSNNKEDWDKQNGLFGYERNGATYVSCRDNFNNHLLDEFKSDWRKLEPGVYDYGADSILNRDYHNILKDEYGSAQKIRVFRDDKLGKLYGEINYPESESPNIDEIFKDGDDTTCSNKVRFINAIKTTLKGNLVGMFVADDICHLFADIVFNGATKTMWYTFDATKSTMDGFVESKVASDNKEFEVSPRMRFTQYPISKDGWLFKTLNRDFT